MAFFMPPSTHHLCHPQPLPTHKKYSMPWGRRYFPCLIKSKLSSSQNQRKKVEQGNSPGILECRVHTEKWLSPKSQRNQSSCLLFWNERSREKRAVRRDWDGIARGRVLGACACQAETDGELTLRIALGGEMWMMTGAHVALNPALSLQAEQ